MEIDYNELFGLEAAAETAEGAEETEVAEPSAVKGAEETELAEPSTAEGAEETEVAEPSVVEEDAKPPRSGRDTEMAAARRKAEAERDAAIEKARRDAEAEARRIIDQAFLNSGLTNPYTKKPITSKAEYDEYRTRFDAEQRERVLKRSGMNQDEFDSYIQNLPEVKQARAEQERARAVLSRARVDEQIREIGKISPEIRSAEDLAAMETYPQLLEKVKQGYSITDAYRLVNYDSLLQKAADGAKQAAVSSVQSKRHLKSTEQRGQGSTVVPREVMEQYRMFNPDATDEEIRAHWAKNHGRR